MLIGKATKKERDGHPVLWISTRALTTPGHWHSAGIVAKAGLAHAKVVPHVVTMFVVAVPVVMITATLVVGMGAIHVEALATGEVTEGGAEMTRVIAPAGTIEGTIADEW